jgi:RimJ/RimL family protein N-acetyltransferase
MNLHQSVVHWISRVIRGDSMTGAVLLRDVKASDLPILFEQQLDPEATAMAAFPSRDREAFDTHWAKIMADEKVILKTVLFDGQVAGSIVSWEMLSERKIGYWFGKEFWGKSIATRALAEYLGIVEARPLYAHVAKHNIGSRRVLEKCGFKVIGEDTYTNPAGEAVEEFILKLE